MNLNPPILGFDDRDHTPAVMQWSDRTPLGILSLRTDPEIEVRIEAEKARKQHIRQSANVIVLDDWRTK